ncbi:MAG: hypothetical protein IT383_09875 [Deltaproteobacteria bacterium]|nr:hypothetical protein [Deltaproteobacteria bacterium]
MARACLARRHLLLPAVLSACIVGPLTIGCPQGCPLPPGPDAGPDGGTDGFDDSTVSAFADLAAFEELAAPSASSTAVKFVITGFLEPSPALRFLDSAAYTLHDEWYWFRLLNNVPVDRVDTAPVDLGRPFATIADIYAWALQQSALPLDLQFVGDGRLYSPLFYQLALYREPKVLGIGTVLRFVERPDLSPPRPELWGMELEYQHAVTEAELQVLLDVVSAGLPPGIGEQLKLLVRSPQQEELARALEDAGSPLAARILRYSDVTVPGETEVYSEGLVAGRLRVMRTGEGDFESARSTDLLVLEDVPDFLPQCAGLITAVPQTALAHVNILAKNRGIPNAYRGGILEDPEIDALARVFAPVVVRAQAPDLLEVVAMTEQEYTQYRQLSAVPPSAVTPVDPGTIEYLYDLEELSFADQESWRPILGGKSAGFLALLDAVDVTLPPRPIGVSVRAYLEHTVALEAELEPILADPLFNQDPLRRALLLEGPVGWATKHPDDPTYADRFLALYPPSDPRRVLVDAGGAQGRILNKPIDPVTLELIEAALTTAFGTLADQQGLRFRSSSNIEDAEGFNGAGLYTSSTGYLHAERLNDARREQTVERALLETWASYWGSEAFEERRMANVAHLSGAMGAVVHPNFQDSLELSNGVFTYTILPQGHADGVGVLELNVQKGALSVTNPPPGDPNLPEVDRIVLDSSGATHIERVRGSTLLPEGQTLQTDAQLLHVFEQARRVAELWLSVENAALAVSQQRSTLTIDFELREMDDGWPAYADGTIAGARNVIKQARTLEPSLLRVPTTVRNMPIPRDVLARARRVEQRTCDAGALRISVTDTFTDPLKTPDLGFQAAPFAAFVIVDFVTDVPELSATAGQRRSAVHTAFAASHPGMAAGGPWSVDIDVDDEREESLGLSRVVWADGSASVTLGAGSFSGPAPCSTTSLYSSPEDFLAGIIDRP